MRRKSNNIENYTRKNPERKSRISNKFKQENITKLSNSRTNSSIWKSRKHLQTIPDNSNTTHIQSKNNEVSQKADKFAKDIEKDRNLRTSIKSVEISVSVESEGNEVGNQQQRKARREPTRKSQRISTLMSRKFSLGDASEKIPFQLKTRETRENLPKNACRPKRMKQNEDNIDHLSFTSTESISKNYEQRENTNCQKASKSNHHVSSITEESSKNILNYHKTTSGFPMESQKLRKKVIFDENAPGSKKTPIEHIYTPDGLYIPPKTRSALNLKIAVVKSLAQSKSNYCDIEKNSPPKNLRYDENKIKFNLKSDDTKLKIIERSSPTNCSRDLNIIDTSTNDDGQKKSPIGNKNECFLGNELEHLKSRQLGEKMNNKSKAKLVMNLKMINEINLKYYLSDQNDQDTEKNLDENRISELQLEQNDFATLEHPNQPCSNPNSIMNIKKENNVLNNFTHNDWYPYEENVYTINEYLDCAMQIKIENHDIKQELVPEVDSRSCNITDISSKDPQTKQQSFICALCVYRTKNRKYFRRHFRDVHDQSREKTCEFCPYRTKKNTLMKSHILYHHTEGPLSVYKCDECAYTTTRKPNISVHCRSQHSTNIPTLYCGLCSFTTRWRSHLYKHVKTKHNTSDEIEIHRCRECSFTTKWQSHLYKHTKDKHQINKREDKRYGCKECDFKAKYRSYLYKHIKEIHRLNGEVKYICDKCDFETRWQSHLYKHQKAKHPKKH